MWPNAASYTTGRSFSTGNAELDAEWFAPNVWPDEVPALQVLCTSYSEAIRGIYAELLEICAVALGLERDWFAARAAARMSSSARLSSGVVIANKGKPASR